MRLFKELKDLKERYEDIIKDLNSIKGLFGKRRRRKYINNNRNTIHYSILYTIKSRYSLKMYIRTNNIIPESILYEKFNNINITTIITSNKESNNWVNLLPR